MENGILTHPVLGELELRKNARARRFSFRMTEGRFRVTVPPLATREDLDRCIKELLPRLLALKERHVNKHPKRIIDTSFRIEADEFRMLVQEGEVEAPTARLMHGVLTVTCPVGTDYENKGLLMDTGHLMCAAQNIVDEEQGIDFVLNTAKNHGELAEYFKALHLHKSTSGNVVSELKKKTIIPKEDFYDRFAQSYAMILDIDQHRPFESSRSQEILELIEPEYVIHEVTAKNREEKLKNVLTQMKALGRI